MVRGAAIKLHALYSPWPNALSAIAGLNYWLHATCRPRHRCLPLRQPTYKPNAIADTIGRFVKECYNASVGLVAILKIFLWDHLLLSAVASSRGS
ncbi:hypothetical protein BGZ57DRAFT_288960 [Hyaloscypha finlandica]|nr:hypothetical protein BGZ57DRAFT_288960 [Hyaloscypha finlandica]